MVTLLQMPVRLVEWRRCDVHLGRVVDVREAGFRGGAGELDVCVACLDRALELGIALRSVGA